ncbi:type I restriction enzyme, S subunit [Corynebacterium pollutisoli]|uniref:Type I restriction enzyme, S subunit n=1 Tax=Corynebacterium pollutisoli TaxID=1610489 RepID=A0A1X7HX77_9CORY|nr:restriction endonuclease subunit S [Corynebacterium pollutisoli]SMG06604.1 type I restriction enzyme, S subunit [Corynebacterium pollutisoli]
MSNCNVPKLRLDGFEGEWTKDKAGNIFIAIDDRGYPQLPVLSATQNKGMIPRSMMGYKIHHDRDNEVGYKRVQIGDFVVHLRSFQGGFAHSYYDGITSPAYHVFRSRHEEEQDDVFWRFCFASPRFIYLLKFVTYGIRDGKSISFPEFLELELKYPSKREQHALSELFTNLDAVIDQHTDKHRVLQRTKTALMQRMFPQDGQTEPDLRLDGFEGAWESAPLSQTTALLTDGDWIESKDQSTEGVRLLQTGNVGVGRFEPKPDNMRWISSETFDRLHCEEVLPGDILISRLPDPAGRACIVPKMPYRMITAVDCAIVRVTADHDPSFVVTYLSTPGYFNHINTLMAGGTRQRVSRSQLSAVQIALPPTLEEQQAIGAVFTKLNTLINAETQLIEKLKHTKSALLQKMFV